MSERHNYTPFGAKLSAGMNMKMLSDARQIFSDWYGINIYSYQFTKQTPTRPKDNLPADALKSCKVCGKSLYSLQSSDDDPMDVLVRASSHCIFRSDLGEEHHTCIKLKSCFNTVGFEPADEITAAVKPPSFDRFHNLELGSSEDEKASEKALRDSYDRDVMPFLKKWCNMDINKKNVMQFMKELRETQDKHLLFFADPASKKVVAKKLLTAVGVDNVRRDH